MGLRFVSIGSLLADGMSVVHLLVNGIAAETMIHGVLLVAGTVLPTAWFLAERLLHRLHKPSPEVLRQLSGFETNFFPTK